MGNANDTNHPGYHYGSGFVGCLFDNGPFHAKTYQDAVESLAFTYQLGRTRKARLKKNGFLPLNKDGTFYCEILPCEEDCQPNEQGEYE